MSMNREQFEHKYRKHKIVIVPNVGPRGRYSVEVSGSLSVLGCCDTVAEADTLAENYLELMREQAGYPEDDEL